MKSLLFLERNGVAKRGPVKHQPMHDNAWSKCILIMFQIGKVLNQTF